MKFIKETFMDLVPIKKAGKPKIDGYSDLCLQQNAKGYSFVMEFKSPVLNKRRYVSIKSFKYGDTINQKILLNVLKQLDIKRGMVASGIDPLELKQVEKVSDKPEKSIKTINECFDTFIESRYFNSLSESTKSGYFGNYKRHVAPFCGKRDITTIKRSEVKKHIETIKHDSIANSVLLIMKKMQDIAIDLELMESPFMYGIEGRACGTSDKILTDTEIVALMSHKDGWDSLRNISKMQLLTGCRVSEVAGMKWNEINMEKKTWTIPHERIKTEREYKKMIRPHVLPLLPMMISILEEQKKHGTTGIVFKKMYEKVGTTDTYYHPSAISKWLVKNVDITEGTHQIRRTVASILSEMPGIGEYDIKLILNHVASGSTKIYINSQQIDRKREVLTKWHNYVNSLIGTELQVAV